MAIQLELDNGTLQTFTCAEVSIGSSAMCDFEIPPAFGIQRQHARIRRVSSRWLLESLGDWLLHVGQADPSHRHWLESGDQINLTERGPILHFVITPEVLPTTALPLKETFKSEVRQANHRAAVSPPPTTSCEQHRSHSAEPERAPSDSKHSRRPQQPQRHRSFSPRSPSVVGLALAIIKPILGALLGISFAYIIVCRYLPESALLHHIAPHLPQSLQPESFRQKTSTPDETGHINVSP